MERKFQAAELFVQGYNCAQAVAAAFSDLMDLPMERVAKMASPFGGGIAGEREVCGAVSGMVIVLGWLYGYECPDDEAKKRTYKQASDLIEEFRKINGNILCRELLKNMPSDPNPTPQTEAYYAKRPCARMVMVATELLEAFIADHSI